MEHTITTPMLFPYEPTEFWQQVRLIIREEVSKATEKQVETTYETKGLTYKPLYKMEEVCGIFSISRPTIYQWIRCGKLRPFKIKSRVYFLWKDIQQLFIS